VKIALDIIQVSLSGLQSAINLMISKFNKNNKAMKDLADIMATI
jgi:hypothetical protein